MSGTWALDEAREHFDEVVQRARTDGPQRISVADAEEVVVIATADLAHERDGRTGQELVNVLREGEAEAGNVAGFRPPVRRA